MRRRNHVNGDAQQPKRYLVTGSSGLVGRAVTSFLADRGGQVTRLVRGGTPGSSSPAASTRFWDPTESRLDPDTVSGFDAVVHLAGAGIADARWSAERKRVIRDSRVRGTDLLARSLAASDSPPRVLVCASAVGYYGDRGDVLLDEGSAPGFGFLAEVGAAWEKAAAPAAEAGIRVVSLRIGVVLSAEGGALHRMLLPFRLGLGGPLGTGRQYWSWITLDELLDVILHAAGSEALSGPVNAVAPGAVRNSEFTVALARALRRPAFLPVPAFALRLLLGEMADELLLASTRVQPARLLESGYEFSYPDIEAALRSVLGQQGDPS
jgi:uncharacterized protein (TIGR01777 family)